MAKPSRNAPCPCGSGKKYKKCCLANDEAAERERRATDATNTQPGPLDALAWEDDGLDDLSNSVLDLIKAKRFEDALAACRRLLDEWPEVVDGLERSAMVYKAMGQPDQALDYYRRALAFTERDDQRPGFDEPGRQYYRDRIAELEAATS
jgi:tetratricopeptide (TPR) repeat protein